MLFCVISRPDTACVSGLAGHQAQCLVQPISGFQAHYPVLTSDFALKTAIENRLLLYVYSLTFFQERCAWTISRYLST